LKDHSIFVTLEPSGKSLDPGFGLADGDVLQVFVSSEIRPREPVRYVSVYLSCAAIARLPASAGSVQHNCPPKAKRCNELSFPKPPLHTERLERFDGLLWPLLLKNMPTVERVAFDMKRFVTPGLKNIALAKWYH